MTTLIQLVSLAVMASLTMMTMMVRMRAKVKRSSLMGATRAKVKRRWTLSTTHQCMHCSPMGGTSSAQCVVVMVRVSWSIMAMVTASYAPIAATESAITFCTIVVVIVKWSQTLNLNHQQIQMIQSKSLNHQQIKTMMRHIAMTQSVGA